VKASELRDLSMDELGAKARELRGELFNAQVKRSTGQLEDTAVVRTLRRDIARVETILREMRGAKS
jgi:large subunit ribosomal protein L29